MKRWVLCVFLALAVCAGGCTESPPPAPPEPPVAEASSYEFQVAKCLLELIYITRDKDVLVQFIIDVDRGKVGDSAVDTLLLQWYNTWHVQIIKDATQLYLEMEFEGQ